MHSGTNVIVTHPRWLLRYSLEPQLDRSHRVYSHRHNKTGLSCSHQVTDAQSGGCDGRDVNSSSARYKCGSGMVLSTAA